MSQSHILHVDWHPLGVVVTAVTAGTNGAHELLIEGEGCCGVSFDKLKQIAESTSHKIEVDDEKAATCRLFQS
jgi:hypothetical protein